MFVFVRCVCQCVACVYVGMWLGCPSEAILVVVIASRTAVREPLPLKIAALQIDVAYRVLAFGPCGLITRDGVSEGNCRLTWLVQMLKPEPDC